MTLSGSAFSQATIFALSIQPYINASIIIQLLTIAIPALERLAQRGRRRGQKKLERITRYTTVGLGLLMGFAYTSCSATTTAASNMLFTNTGSWLTRYHPDLYGRLHPGDVVG